MIVNFWGELIFVVVGEVFNDVCRVYFPVFQREFNTARTYNFNENREKKLREIKAVYSTSYSKWSIGGKPVKFENNFILIVS